MRKTIFFHFCFAVAICTSGCGGGPEDTGPQLVQAAQLLLIIGSLAVIGGFFIKEDFLKPFVIVLGVIILVFALFLFMLGQSFSHTQESMDKISEGPDHRIKTNSENIECGKDILRALEAIRKERGLLYEIDSADAQALFDTGHLQKIYYRDAIKISCGFGLIKSETNCRLILYERETINVGTKNTEWGNFGSAELEKCECDSI